MDYDKLIEQLNAWNEQHLSVVCGGKHFACDYLCENEDCIVVRAATALSTLQAENEKLRTELEQVTAERDAVIKELNGVSSLVDDLAEFVDREIHPVVDYNLYLDLRENVDAVSMFQHEDEWRGPHKED